MTAWYEFPVTHGFFSQYNPSVFDTPHFANDLATPFHTSLTTWKSGTIVQSDFAPWGGEVYVKPDDGTEEFYFAHLDDINVHQGQHVNAGQSLGLSGGQTSGGDHPTSPQWSTGPHTHVGYIQGYRNTPVGSRPYGDDITPTIQKLKGGGMSGIAPLSFTQLASVQGQQVQLQQTQNLNTYKIGLFVVALILIGAGFYFVFQKQINEAVKSGKSVVEKAAILAV